MASLIHDNRVSHVCPADYSEGSDMDILVKTIIDKIDLDDRLAKTRSREITRPAGREADMPGTTPGDGQRGKPGIPTKDSSIGKREYGH